MKTMSKAIRAAISSAHPKLLGIDPEIARRKSSPETYSKKEVLGHLIDSAANNHQRFVRGSQDAARDFPTYNQTRWVQVQCYNEMDWHDLVSLFVQYNYHLCRVIDVLPPNVSSNPINIGKDAPATLGFVIEDYLRHLRLHLEQILGPLG